MKFEDLNAWQRARELSNAVYHMVKTSELAKDYGLRDQLHRAAVSVMNNVAEGFERKHKAEKKQLYNVAKASAGEVRSMCYLIGDQELAPSKVIQNVSKLSSDCSALIQGLIRSTEK